MAVLDLFRLDDQAVLITGGSVGSAMARDRAMPSSACAPAKPRAGIRHSLNAPTASSRSGRRRGICDP